MTTDPTDPDRRDGDIADIADLDDGDGDGDDGERIVLRASTAKWVWVLVGCLVFFTFGAGMALGQQIGLAGKIIGCVICALFGFCALVAVRELAAPGSMLIGRSSFELISIRRHTVYAFADCGPFLTWRNPSRGSTTVVFDYAPDGDSSLAVQNRALMGGSRSLPDSFGIAADELARVLNEMRSAAP